MSASGEEYIGVYAATVDNGISTLDASGEIGSGEGGTEGTWWLLWDYSVVGEIVTGGYTNISWHWGVNNNYLTQSYNEKYGSTYGYDEEGFKKYLAAEQPKTLNELLGGWPYQSKVEFVNWIKAVYPTTYMACVEIR